MQLEIADITHAIQLAVAPVFLLTAIATVINVLSGRLSRIVDRRRVLNGRVATAANSEQVADDVEELQQLEQRGKLIYHAMFFSVLGALLVCLVVATAFLGTMVSFNVGVGVAVFFVLAMASMILSLTHFLRETYLAVRHRGKHWR